MTITRPAPDAAIISDRKRFRVRFVGAKSGAAK
jgi:hypothetical protein